MRLPALVLTAVVVAVPAFARSGQSDAAASTRPDGGGAPTAAPAATTGEAVPLEFPVSLDKIRDRLEHAPAKPLKLQTDEPVFRVQISEKQRFEELVSKIKFEKGPQLPPGGLYAYEQQQVIWSKQQNPEMQPYGAFNQGQLATILFEQFVEKYLGGKAISALSGAERERAEAAARAEVQQALADYWSYQAQQSSASPPGKP